MYNDKRTNISQYMKNNFRQRPGNKFVLTVNSKINFTNRLHVKLTPFMKNDWLQSEGVEIYLGRESARHPKLCPRCSCKIRFLHPTRRQ